MAEQQTKPQSEFRARRLAIRAEAVRRQHQDRGEKIRVADQKTAAMRIAADNPKLPPLPAEPALSISHFTRAIIKELAGPTEQVGNPSRQVRRRAELLARKAEAALARQSRRKGRIVALKRAA